MKQFSSKIAILVVFVLVFSLLPISSLSHISNAAEPASVFTDSFENKLNTTSSLTSTYYKKTIPSSNKISYVGGKSGKGVHLDSLSSYVGYSSKYINPEEGTIRFYFKPDSNIYTFYNTRQPEWKNFESLEPAFSGIMLDSAEYSPDSEMSAFGANILFSGDPKDKNISISFTTWSASSWRDTAFTTKNDFVLSADKFYDFAFTWSKSEGTIKLYIDGKLKATAIFETPVSNTEIFFLGQNPFNDYWPYGPHSLIGTYDELKIYNIALKDFGTSTPQETPKGTIVIKLTVGKSTFTVNGATKTLDSPPVIKTGRTLLPIRAVIEAMGGTVGWNSSTKEVKIVLGNNTIQLWVGKSTAKVNGVTKTLDVAPQIINGRTMVPVRFVTENLGATVGFDDKTKVVTITYSGGTVEDYTLEKSQVISSAGGKLTTDDFSLTVPSGAFNSEAKLELYVSPTYDPFGNDGVSKTFRIEGLPDEYSKPLQVQIKYQGNLSGKSFIALGEDVFIRSLNTTETAYNLFPATASNGYLVCELPVPEQEKRTYSLTNKTVQDAEPGYSRTTLQAVTGRGTYTSDKKHFEIIYPAFVANEVSDLADFLEEAYSEFQGMGFSYAARTEWPISVTVKDLGPELYGCSACSAWGDNYGYMEFNADKMDDLPDMRITAGHEFFHLVQALYDPRNRFSKAKFASPHYWLDEATAVWSEEKFSNESNYCSPIRKGHEMAPFSGMQAGANENAQHYGYGMSAMIKYLVNRYGEDVLVDIYEEIHNGAHPIKAISSSTDPFAVWWNTFLNDYVLGKVYTDVSSALWVGNVSGNFKISSASDTSKTFSATYPDLSAKLYTVTLGYPSTNSNAAIKFKVTGEAAHVTVFKYKPGSIEYLGSATDEVPIYGVKKLTDDKWNLLVLVSDYRDVSPYTGTTNIGLEIGVSPVVTSIDPTSGKVGDTITINGYAFGKTKSAKSRVTINGKNVDIVSWSDKVIKVKLTEDVGSGPVIVYTGEKYEYKSNSDVKFTFVQTPPQNKKYDGFYFFKIRMVPSWDWDIGGWDTLVADVEIYLMFDKGTITTARSPDEQTDYDFEKISGTYDDKGNITFTFTINWEDKARSQGSIYTGTFTGKFVKTDPYYFEGTASGKVRNYTKVAPGDYDETTDFNCESYGYFVLDL